MSPAGRLLALDVGDRRIGVAVSDPLGVTARPLLTLERKRAADDVAAVAQLVSEWEARILIVGHPLLPSGDRGEQALRVEAFVRRLKRAVDVPVSLWDESYTTVAALERMKARGVSEDDIRQRIDAEAAAVILEEWMRERENSPGANSP